MSAARKTSRLGRFIKLCKPYRGMFIIVLLASGIHQAVNLVFPWLAGRIMDEVITGQSQLSRPERMRLLWQTGSIMLLLGLGSGAVLFLRGNLLGKLLWRVIFSLRQQLNWHLQKLSLSFFAKQQTGRLVSRLMSDINQASALISQGGVNLLLDVLSVTAIIIILLRISPMLTGVSLLLMPIYIVAFRTISPRIRKASKAVQRHMAVMSGNIQEKFSGIAVIQSFCGEKEEHENFATDNEAYTQKVLQRRNLNLSMMSISSSITLLSRGVILVVGGYLALSGVLSAGQVLSFILYVGLFYAPLARLSEINIQMQTALGSLDRVFELLDLTPEIKNAPNPVRKLQGLGKLEFDSVCFSYEQGNQILYDLSFSLQPGAKVAVIGPSGAGKSTLAGLVPRLYDVDQGCVLIDNVDVRDIALETLRRSVGVVQQEPFLFSTTIKENILYGRRDAKMDQVIAAAKAAHAHDFISDLHDSYESLVGERGVNLSVGQRQRICLARTILKDPRVLILDEATSSLDSESENLIQAAMEELMKGRTSIIIAHRLSTIMGADFVLVLEKGRIVEQGTHSELWQQGQLYTSLLQQQFGPLQELIELGKQPTNTSRRSNVKSPQ